MTKNSCPRWLRVILTLSIVLLTVVVIAYGREVKQVERNRALIAVVRKRDVAAVRNLLLQGADATIHDSEEDQENVNLRLTERITRLFHRKQAVNLFSAHSINPSLLNIVLEDACNNYISDPEIISEDDAIGEMLVMHGADRHTGTLWLETPVQCAVKSRLTRTLRILLTRGVAVKDMNDALIGADAETTALLLRYGASPDVPTEYGRPALPTAAQDDNGGAAVVRLLLAAGANPDMKDSEGVTALMLADVPETAQLLIRYGANVNAKDSAGQSVLAYKEQLYAEETPGVAPVGNHAQVLRLLKQHGAKR